ncbi:MAG: hypothetical protein RIR26_764 [Pseudomonadota bacterium]
MSQTTGQNPKRLLVPPNVVAFFAGVVLAVSVGMIFRKISDKMEAGKAKLRSKHARRTTHLPQTSMIPIRHSCCKRAAELQKPIPPKPNREAKKLIPKLTRIVLPKLKLGMQQHRQQTSIRQTAQPCRKKQQTVKWITLHGASNSSPCKSNSQTKA